MVKTKRPKQGNELPGIAALKFDVISAVFGSRAFNKALKFDQCYEDGVLQNTGRSTKKGKGLGFYYSFNLVKTGMGPAGITMYIDSPEVDPTIKDTDAKSLNRFVRRTHQYFNPNTKLADDLLITGDPIEGTQNLNIDMGAGIIFSPEKGMPIIEIFAVFLAFAKCVKKKSAKLMVDQKKLEKLSLEPLEKAYRIARRRIGNQLGVTLPARGPMATL